MTIKIYSNVQEMTGQGEEWLVAPETGEVIAVLIDGNFRDDSAASRTIPMGEGVTI